MVCMWALVVGGIGSLILVFLWLWLLGTGLTPFKRELEELELAWQRVEVAWRSRKRRKAAGYGLWQLWRAYAAWKRKTLVGFIDLTLMRFVFLLSLAVLTIDVCDVALALIEWVRESKTLFG